MKSVDWKCSFFALEKRFESATRVLRRHLHGLPSQRRLLCLCCFGSWYLVVLYSILKVFFASWILRLTFQTILHGKAVLAFTGTYEMAVKSDTVFFTHEKNRIGLVIGHTIFFACEENRMTNRIASQKSGRFLFEAFVMCKSQYSYNNSVYFMQRFLMSFFGLFSNMWARQLEPLLRCWKFKAFNVDLRQQMF